MQRQGIGNVNRSSSGADNLMKYYHCSCGKMDKEQDLLKVLVVLCLKRIRSGTVGARVESSSTRRTPVTANTVSLGFFLTSIDSDNTVYVRTVSTSLHF